jgi:DNA-binding transcriptional MerR regulator
MDGFRTKELADWLGLSEVTVRQWTTGEWKDYLSPTAHGGNGRRRYFSDQDARIVALIFTLKEQGESRDGIHAALKRLQTEGWVDLPDMPPAPPNLGPISMIPREAAETAVSTQRAALLREIAMLQERVENLETSLAKERELLDQERKRADERVEAERQKTQELREVMQKELTDLRVQLAESKTELRLYQQGRLKPDQDT